MGALKDLKQGLTDKLIRMRARPRLCATPFDEFQVSIAQTVEDHREAFRLVQIAYAWLGIESVDGPEMRMTPQHVLPESTIFIVRDNEGRLVGTMTVTLDSDAGLPLDHDYPEELKDRRGPKRRLVEYGSLAVVARCKHRGVTTLLTMAANWFSLYHLRATDVVMGVHPKAAALYRALFNFQPLAAARDHVELEAPVQGMAQDLATLEDWFRPRYGCKSVDGMSLHSHFFEELPPRPGEPGTLEAASRCLPPHLHRRLRPYGDP
ncbi:MAG: hypothetical protein JRH20_23475 [Deltaproteobacteria bacterium]|nr:hypothetical protein [Deltaproteobacteria bacterium]